MLCNILSTHCVCFLPDARPSEYLTVSNIQSNVNCLTLLTCVACKTKVQIREISLYRLLNLSSVGLLMCLRVRLNLVISNAASENGV